MLGNEFYHISDLKEACLLLEKKVNEAKIIAGGTDLMVEINRRKIFPQALIYIGDLGLSYIKNNENNLIIGATTTHTDIVNSKIASEHIPLLVEACRSIGSPAIRNMATIGGNLCTSSPAGDACVALLALDARLKVVSSNRERIIDIEKFFIGRKENVLLPDELLKEIIIPINGTNKKWAWYKQGQRKAQAISVVSIAVNLVMDRKICKEVRVALGAVAPLPILINEPRSILEGKEISTDLIEEFASRAADGTSCIDDIRSKGWYRKKICEVMINRLLSKIIMQ